MSGTYLAAFVCYGISTLLCLVSAITYLVRSTFMPYHQQALGKSWQELDQNLQVLLLGLMRTTGGGFLAAGIAAAVMLFIPFREQQSWAKYALLAVGLVAALSALYVTSVIRLRTRAHTPVALGAVGVVLVLVGFILSMV